MLTRLNGSERPVVYKYKYKYENKYNDNNAHQAEWIEETGRMEEERRRLAARREELKEQKKVMTMVMILCVMTMAMTMVMVILIAATVIKIKQVDPQMWEKYQKMAGSQPKQNKSLESLLGGRKLKGFVNAINSKVRH